MLKRTLPLIIVFVSALLIVVAFFIPHRPFGDLESRFLNWFAIISGFTFLLGIDSLTRHHLTRVIRRSAGWGYSLLLIVSLFATIALGLYSWIRFRSPFSLQAPFMWLYTNMIIPLQSTMFASLAFFIVSAAYRAFRVRNTAATLLLVAAVLVMIGNVPMGGTLWRGIAVLIHGVFPGLPIERIVAWNGFAAIKEWLMAVPQAAAGRGIGLGIALGGIAMSLRIILGIERTYMS